MPVSYQAKRFKTLILAAMACCLTVGSFNASAQDIVLGEDDFEAAKPAQQLTREGLVQEQIAAGEFGPAVKTAQAAKTADERGRLMKMIAEAQAGDGELDAAISSVRMQKRQEKKASRKQQDKGLAGGIQANFGPLMQLIQSQTAPPAKWEQLGDEDGGTMQPFFNGVLVEPGGIIRAASQLETAGRLAGLVNQARSAVLNMDVAQQADVRFISLKRLEQAVTERQEAGLPIVETMRNMGGLVRVRYVMVLPKENDIVIGGPAEPWRYDASGQPVGAISGRPTLQLDDLVTMLRTFSQSGSGRFLCSIDPRPEGMKAITKYVQQTASNGVSDVTAYKRKLQDKLGLQDVRLEGIAKNSRVARVIVEADYRMKMIGIGKLKGVEGIESFFDLLPKVAGAAPKKMDALRWWLTMKYDSILHNTDRTAFELTGSSVLCMSENQLVTAQGQRVATGQAEPVNRAFAANFTKHYERLAERDLVFADLQNVFDLALVAAIIWDERLDDQAQWNRGSFATTGDYATATYEPPKQVMSVVNHRTYNGDDIVIQVAGGVNGNVMRVVRDGSKRVAGRVAASSKVRPTSDVPANRWWWNAK